MTVLAVAQEENEEFRQLIEVRKTMITPGWGYLVALWDIQREQIISDFEKASLQGPKQEHGAEFYQGKIAGYDAFIRVCANSKRKYEDEEQKRFEEEKEKQEASLG